ncbi:MAG: gliding motility protein GldN [Sphingobacteriales bacterium]|nr:MAG: gliding motility protein GldN [Sphingobacteriales bacterium]
MKRLFWIASFLCFTLLLTVTSFAQTKEGYEEGGAQGGQPQESPSSETEGSVVRDGAYDKNSIKEKKILQYDHIREADVFWEKRVWRVIDTRQKMNLPFVYPKHPFIQVLLDIINQHPNDAKIFMDDEFKQQVSLKEIQSQLGSVDTVQVFDPDKDEYIQKIVTNDFNWMNVSLFRLKEDWIFDEESASMVARIMGIGPIMDVIDDNGNYRGQKAMFWAYYPSFRPFFINNEVFSPTNDAMKLTWDDIFEMRLFGSYIMKASNIQDRRIQEYAAGRDALLESEKIKKEIFEKEHNMWTY